MQRACRRGPKTRSFRSNCGPSPPPQAQGPTNSGKTHEALQHLRRSESGVYCGPLRLLAWQVRQGRVGGAGGCAVLLVGWVVRWLQWALGACCVAVHACCLNSNRPQSCWPTSPLQVHDQLCAGGLPTNLVTGQERRQVAGARHTACTTEMASTAHPVDVAVS